MSLSAWGENCSYIQQRFRHFIVCFFLENEIKKKSLPVARVEIGAFGSIVRCEPDWYYRIHTLFWILNLYKERKYAWRTLWKFLHWISSNFSASLRQQFFLIIQVNNFMNQCLKFWDVAFFAILIQISFKLIHDIDRIYLINRPFSPSHWFCF